MVAIHTVSHDEDLLMSISHEKAFEIALNQLRPLDGKSEDRLALQSDQTVRISKGWIFFWNSKKFIESRDWREGLVGNGPIFVSNSGAAQFLPTHTHWKDLIEKL